MQITTIIKKEENGITLIALVVTIVVLLILAGVTINSVIGDGGIIQKAREAANKTNEAIKNEEENLNSFVDNFNNGQYNKEPEKEPEINLENLKSELESNPDKFKNADQSEDNEDRAIGTDGKSVNLDLWNYYITEDGQGVSLGKIVGSTWYCGYNGKIINGEIEGKMPEYIYLKEMSKVYTVTALLSTFDNYADYGENIRKMDTLTNPPELPSNVVTMTKTFFGCTGLTRTPEFPKKLEILSSGEGAMRGVFYGCTSLTTISEIPETVTDMDEAFSGCKNIEGVIKINSKNITKGYCFDSSLSNNIILQVPENSTTYNTFNNSCGSNPKITIEQY